MPTQTFADEDFHCLIPDYENCRPKIALALSGGGSRGLSHVGALKSIEATGARIDYLVGTSIGAIIGGLYSSGYSASDLDSIVNNTDWADVFSLSNSKDRQGLFLDQKIIEDRNLLTLHFKDYKFVVPEAISVGNRFNSYLQELVWNGLYHGNGDFNNLKYRFRAVVTDLVSGSTIPLSDGNLISAIRASAAIPLRYTPVRIDSMVLVDGGLKGNIPASIARRFEPDLVVAVNAESPLMSPEELNTPWNIADQYVTIMIKHFSQHADTSADINISPDLSNHSNSDFSNMSFLVERGQQAGDSAKPKIESYVDAYVDSVISFRTKSCRALINNFSDIDVVIKDFYEQHRSELLRKRFDYSGIFNVLKTFVKQDFYQSISVDYKASEKQLTITANHYPEFGELVFHNLSLSMDEQLLQNSVKEFVGSPLNYSNRTKIFETLLRTYRNHDYSFASIIATETDSARKRLTVVIDEGRTADINIITSDNLNTFLILREIDIKPGDPVNARKLHQAWNNLMSTDIISDVKIEPVASKTGPGIDLNFYITESGSQSIRIGARVDNERKTQIGIEFIDDNTFNFGDRTNLRLSGGLRNQRISLSYDVPRIFDTPFAFMLSGYGGQTLYYRYAAEAGTPRDRIKNIRLDDDRIVNRFGFETSLGIQLERFGLMSLIWRYEMQQNYIQSQVPDDYYSLSTIKIATTYDTKDKADFPGSGRYIHLSLETNMLFSEKSAKFSKIVYEHAEHYSTGDHTFIPSFIFGVGDVTLPFPEQFTLTGNDCFYGLRENESRGRQLMKAALEYRYKLPFKMFFDSYFSAAYNVGSTWDKPEQVKFEGLQHGAGIMLSFDTPIGPAHFSTGRSFRFLRNPNEIAIGDQMFYFSIGIKM